MLIDTDETQAENEAKRERYIINVCYTRGAILRLLRSVCFVCTAGAGWSAKTTHHTVVVTDSNFQFSSRSRKLKQKMIGGSK